MDRRCSRVRGAHLGHRSLSIAGPSAPCFGARQKHSRQKQGCQKKLIVAGKCGGAPVAEQRRTWVKAIAGNRRTATPLPHCCCATALLSEHVMVTGRPTQVQGFGQGSPRRRMPRLAAELLARRALRAPFGISSNVAPCDVRTENSRDCRQVRFGHGVDGGQVSYTSR